MRRLCGFLLVGLVLFAAGAPAVRMKVPPPTVKSRVEGRYEIRREGVQVGTEDFARTLLSSNTVIFESAYEVVEKDGGVVTGNNRLELEEDSGFPRSYYTFRRTQKDDGENEKEVTAEMFANVVVLSERQDEQERQRVLELPTGCLFVEGNIAHQLSVVIPRYDMTSGGKQGFRAFDPLGGATTDVALEYVGDTTLTAPVVSDAGVSTGESVSHYRYYSGRFPAIDVYVATDGIISRIDIGFRETEYVLSMLEEHEAQSRSIESPRSPESGE